MSNELVTRLRFSPSEVRARSLRTVKITKIITSLKWNSVERYPQLNHFFFSCYCQPELRSIWRTKHFCTKGSDLSLCSKEIHISVFWPTNWWTGRHLPFQAFINLIDRAEIYFQFGPLAPGAHRKISSLIVETISGFVDEIRQDEALSVPCKICIFDVFLCWHKFQQLSCYHW